MTGTVTIVTIYNNFNGAEITALMNESELRALIESDADITFKTRSAETVTAAEVMEILKLR